MRPATHRALLVDAMRDLTQGKGFAATTVDEVCERAGVTKGSFYHHFGSKDELGLAALQAYFDDVQSALRAGSWSRKDSAVERLHAFVAHAGGVCAGPVMAGGCLLVAFTLEQAGNVPETRGRLVAMFAELHAMVADLINAAAREVARSVDAGRLADQFLAVVEGSLVLAKAHADESIPKRLLATFDDHLGMVLES